MQTSTTQSGNTFASFNIRGNQDYYISNNAMSGSNSFVSTYWHDPNSFSQVSSTGIITPQIRQTSLEKQKKNFEKLEKGLDIIKDIDIYKYNLKSETDDTKKHIGFIIGDKYKYSKEITSNENDGVDIYSFVSVCCKAIQEQQEQIEELKEEIKKLGGNK